MTGPIDRSELSHKEHVEADGKQVEIEQQAEQAHRQPAERTAQKQQARIAAETAEALADERAFLGLSN